MRRASLPWYDLPELKEATDAFWRSVARRLRAEALVDVPDELARDDSPETDWTDPGLLLSQTCGYPLTHAFAGALRLVAIPCYDAPGCGRGTYRSLVIVGRDSNATSMVELAGKVCAINDPTSHSGMNSLRALVAPLTEGRPFFERVVTTGSHVASLAAVANGEADVAAVDCVTYALVGSTRKVALDGTRVLTSTEEAPAPPFVTRASATDQELDALRRALAAVIADPDLEAVRGALRLRDIVVPPSENAAYARILSMERTAADLGYPRLA